MLPVKLPARSDPFEQSPQQHWLHPPPKSHPAVDLDDRHAHAEPLDERRIRVNVDALWLQTVLLKERFRIVAEMATRACVKHNAWLGQNCMITNFVHCRLQRV